MCAKRFLFAAPLIILGALMVVFILLACMVSNVNAQQCTGPECQATQQNKPLLLMTPFGKYTQGEISNLKQGQRVVQSQVNALSQPKPAPVINVPAQPQFDPSPIYKLLDTVKQQADAATAEASAAKAELADYKKQVEPYLTFAQNMKPLVEGLREVGIRPEEFAKEVKANADKINDLIKNAPDAVKQDALVKQLIRDEIKRDVDSAIADPAGTLQGKIKEGIGLGVGNIKQDFQDLKNGLDLPGGGAPKIWLFCLVGGVAFCLYDLHRLRSGKTGIVADVSAKVFGEDSELTKKLRAQGSEISAKLTEHKSDVDKKLNELSDKVKDATGGIVDLAAVRTTAETALKTAMEVAAKVALLAPK